VGCQVAQARAELAELKFPGMKGVVHAHETDDAPELTEADFARAIYRVGGKEVSREEWRVAAKAAMTSEHCEYSDSGFHECKHCDTSWVTSENGSEGAK
jgi:hypothetical protein